MPPTDHLGKLIEDARVMAGKVLMSSTKCVGDPLLEKSFEYWQSILLAADGAPMGLTLVEGVSLLSFYRDMALMLNQLADALEACHAD